MLAKLPPKILIVESNPAMSRNVRNIIDRYWFDVMSVRDSENALRMVVAHFFHLIIIGSSISAQCTMDLANELYKISELQGLPVLPIICLIQEQESINRYNQLIRTGICELIYQYQCSQYATYDLIAAIGRLLKRAKSTFQERIIRYDDITMDLSTYRIQKGSQEIYLGLVGFRILQLFLQKPRSIHSRQQIIDYVWGMDKNIAPRTIDVYVNRLRLLVTADINDYSIIKTTRSLGYGL